MALAAVLLLTSCTANEIEGRVVSVTGEGLPGVVVTVEGMGFQALTNTNGYYTVGFRPGTVTLRFAKSGYTPGQLELGQITEPGSVQAVDVRLWRLPPARGVYLFEDNDYQWTTALEPERHLTEDLGIVYGFKRSPKVQTLETTPELIGYKVSHNDVRLARMARREVRLTGFAEAKGTIEIYATEKELPVTAATIDDQSRELFRIDRATDAPLEPGIYAVHWGALDGYTTTDARVFAFEIVAPPAEDDEKTDEQPQEGDTP